MSNQARPEVNTCKKLTTTDFALASAWIKTGQESLKTHHEAYRSYEMVRSQKHFLTLNQIHSIAYKFREGP